MRVPATERLHGRRNAFMQDGAGKIRMPCEEQCDRHREVHPERPNSWIEQPIQHPIPRAPQGAPSAVNGGTCRSGDERLDLLLQRLDALEKRSGPGHQAEPMFRLRSPFSERILRAPLPNSFQMSPILRYDRTADPQEHFNRYQTLMNVHVVTFSEEVLCRSFPATLDGLASEWFNELPEGKIDSWEDLARRFLVHFAGNRKKKLYFSHLLSVRQRPDEPLREFLARWKLETTRVYGTDEKTRLSTFHLVLQSGDFSKRLALEKLREYAIALAMAEDEAEAEELEANKKKEEEGRLGTMVATTRPPARKVTIDKRSHLPAGHRFWKGRDPRDRRSFGKDVYEEGVDDRKPYPPKGPKLIFPYELTPLTHPVSAILDFAEHQGLVEYDPRFPPICTVGEGPYYRFHIAAGHDTDACKVLKREIKNLIQAGYLRQFVKKKNTWRKDDGKKNVDNQGKKPAGTQQKKRKEIGLPSDEEDEANPRQKMVEENRMIYGGNTGGDSAEQRKRWVHSAYVGDVCGAPGPSKVTKTEPLLFGPKDLPEIPSPHRDALVVKCEINETKKMDAQDLRIDSIATALLKEEEGRPRAEPAEETDDVVIMEDQQEKKIKLADAEPIEQRRRHLSKDRRDFVKKEVDMLQAAGHVKEIKYPTWLANVVQVPKGQIFRMCVDYTDQTAGCEVMSFMDAFRGYRQVFMHEEDAEKTAFLTPEGVYCYLVMAFGLKNSGATYTRMVSPVFHSVLGKTMAAYVDDMIVKSKQSSDHAEDLSQGECWTLFTDGSLAAKACGGGVVIQSPEGFRSYHTVKFQFKVSNNEAEYEALLSGLRIILNLKAKYVRIRCDSGLVVSQIKGEFDTKEERMRLYKEAALELLKILKGYELVQILRAENTEADALSKLSNDSPEHISNMAHVEDLGSPSIHIQLISVITGETDGWIAELIRYKKDGILPSGETAARLIKRRAPTYVIENGRLYKRSCNGTLLRCVDEAKAEQIMEEVHEGVCEAHQGPFSMARRIVLQGYFWPTMVKDCARRAKRCKVCQIFQNIPGRPGTNYHPIISSIPFAHWGIDLIGLMPRVHGNFRWIIVAIDYFTKWIEAEPLVGGTAEQGSKFVSNNILSRYGVPKQITTDNGTQFEARDFNELLQGWKIKHTYSSVAYPQGNGQVENANRTIMDGIKKRLESYKGAWVDQLPDVLWAYRTTPRRATGETPFSMCYGLEARAPSEVFVPTWREEKYEARENEETMTADLHLVEEHWERAFLRAENYRRQVKEYYDRKVRAREFRVGDLVLRKREAS
ncbi:unnamed protein product [Cuscuta campestris]|uniref:Integrase catalytic domain-containing protein n=1 Tax=Cuscuta campestris TaxID=132261 RepID=A0A484KXR5_9ASTE|nr:unnamed protein product [Cuscuta campestris]